jgi:hypothetical protein
MLRGKGFVRTAHGLRLVQGVGRRIDLTEPPFVPPADLVGRVVIITRDREVSASHGDTSDRHPE